MIRFPNPGSDISSFIRIFQSLYTYLKEYSSFSLDDISKTLTEMHLVASSGYVGKKALEASTRADRSRDPLYNQSKMYAELYRLLGWMASSDPNSILSFRFTLLGEQVANATVDSKIIFEECIIGITYPNEILEKKGCESSRVFLLTLKMADELNGYISRDEIILTVLNMNDNNPTEFQTNIKKIQDIRKGNSLIKYEIKNLSEKIGIQINTMQNYTRFPLSVLQFCGWFVRESTKNIVCLQNNSLVMFKLTEYGKKRISEFKQLFDIRLENLKGLDNEKKNSLIRLGYYSMLKRANFDLNSVSSQIFEDEKNISKILSGRAVLFSPYQTIKPEKVDYALKYCRIQAELKNHRSSIAQSQLDTNKESTTFFIQKNTKNNKIDADSKLGFFLKELIEAGKDDSEIGAILYEKFLHATKTTFYPLIAEMFSIIGTECKVSRAGINYERWDAIIIDESKSIPIEIKSPTEEMFLSVKAVRQALENKIILLSRQPYKTDWETTTLAVGYKLPNDRAEVTRLIAEIKEIYGITIGIIDFYSLAMLASSTIRTGKNFVEQLQKMRGVINVEII